MKNRLRKVLSMPLEWAALLALSGCLMMENSERIAVINRAYLTESLIYPGSGPGLLSPVMGSPLFQHGKWVPPIALNQNFEIDPLLQAGCKDSSIIMEYPSGCVSTVTVYSSVSYTAEIDIFNSFGRKVYSSEQQFGSCGELDNPSRENPNGNVNWLVWNLKDDDNVYVPDGHYHWMVTYRGSDGQSYNARYTQSFSYKGRPQYCEGL